jgi:hypothetical protein
MVGLMWLLLQSPAPIRIVAEPDFLISRDGDVPHIEAMVAAHPKRPDVLVVGAIVGGRPGGGFHCKSYASADGGRSWIDGTFPDQVRYGGRTGAVPIRLKITPGRRVPGLTLRVTGVVR